MNQWLFGLLVLPGVIAASASTPPVGPTRTLRSDTLVVPPDIHAQSLTSDSITFIHRGVRATTSVTFRIGPNLVLIPGTPAPRAAALVIDGTIVAPFRNGADIDNHLQGRAVESVEVIKGGLPGPGSIDHAFLILTTRPQPPVD